MFDLDFNVTFTKSYSFFIISIPLLWTLYMDGSNIAMQMTSRVEKAHRLRLISTTAPVFFSKDYITLTFYRHSANSTSYL